MICMSLLHGTRMPAAGSQTPNMSRKRGLQYEPALTFQVHDKVCRLFVGESSYPSWAPACRRDSRDTLNPKPLEP